MFSGTVQAKKFLDASGKDMMTNGKFDSDYLNLLGLNINNNFIIDASGNVTINSSSINWNAVTGTAEIDNRITIAQNMANDAKGTANDAYTKANSAKTIANTIINGHQVISPTIVGGDISGVTISGGVFYDSGHKGKLKLADSSSNFSDFIYSNAPNGYEIFKVRDNLGGVALYLYGVPIMWANANNEAGLYSGVKAEAVFG